MQTAHQLSKIYSLSGRTITTVHISLLNSQKAQWLLPVFILGKLPYQVLKVLLPHQEELDGHQGQCKKPLFPIHSCPEFISYSFHF